MSSTRPRRLRRAATAFLVLVPLAFAGASSALSVTLVPVKANPDINEYLPSAAGDWVGWTANTEKQPGAPKAYVQQAGHGKVRLNPSGTYGEAGGFDGTTFVWTQWSKRKAADIWQIDLDTGVRARYGQYVNTPYAEFQPSLSGKWLVFTRYNWDIRQYGVILYNTEGGGQHILDTGTPNKPPLSAQINGNFVVWTKVNRDNSRVFRYRIPSGDKETMPQTQPWAYGPSVAADGTVYFATSGNSCGANVKLHRWTWGRSTEILRKFPKGIDAFNTYVNDLEDGGREVLVDRAACGRKTSKWRDVYKFVDSYTFTVTKAGTGSGTVTSEPAGIDCGSDCTQIYPRGTTVTFTATPDEGSVVSAWSVPGCGTATTCAVDVVENQSVKVTFQPAP